MNNAILKSHLQQSGLTHEEAAMRLQKLTGDPVHPRTVQRWTADPEKTKYARRCPGWVLRLLGVATTVENDPKVDA